MFLRYPFFTLVLLVFFFPLGLITCYFLSTLFGDTPPPPALPFISETGTNPPESCIFGQVLDWSSFLFMILCYVRYLQVEKYIQMFVKDGDKTTIHNLNVVGSIIGLISAGGMSAVGNFQMTNMLVIHVIVASLAFGGAGLYMLINCYISVNDGITGLCTTLARCAITAVYLGAGVYLTLYISGTEEQVFWAAVSEWSMAFLAAIYFGTFFGEFWRTTIHNPEIDIRDPRIKKEVQSQKGQHHQTTNVQVVVYTDSGKNQRY